MTSSTPTQPFIFDTGPLLTLAVSSVDKTAAIDYLLAHIDVIVVETVAQEATMNPTYRDAVVIQQRLNTGKISRLPIPKTSVDHFLDAYTNIGGKRNPGKGERGKGERDTIRLGISLGARVVIDDQAAFFLAARFDLNPIMLLDVIVELTRFRNISKRSALDLIAGISPSGRYSLAAIDHTVYKIGEVL